LKKPGFFIILLILLACGDDFPDFNPSIDKIYQSEFKVWKKKDVAVENITGEITINETREMNLRYIFYEDQILRSTNDGISYDTLTDIHISMDSISYAYPNNGMSESFYVRDMFRMRNASLEERDVSNPRDEIFPELKGFYLFLELEDKEKKQAENSVITETYLLYSEGFPE
jgi:hypothetical protein